MADQKPPADSSATPTEVNAPAPAPGVEVGHDTVATPSVRERLMPAAPDAAAVPAGAAFSSVEPLARPPGSRLRSFARRAAERWRALPAGARAAVAGGALFVLGLLLGGPLFHARGASPTAELARFARRVHAPEGETARRALALNDVASALAAFRTPEAYDHLRADPPAEALRARLALATHDSADALDWLEQALGNAPSLASEDWAADAVVQTYGANKPARSGALLARLPRSAATAALRSACSDWQYRVRHGAADALRAQGDSCPDPTGLLILDAWQLDRCEAARPVVKSLVAAAQSDDRVPPVLSVISRRSNIGGCVADLLPRPAR